MIRFDFSLPGSMPFVAPTRIGPGKKSVGKVLKRKRAILPEPLTRQLRRQQERLAMKGRALI